MSGEEGVWSLWKRSHCRKRGVVGRVRCTCSMCVCIVHVCMCV